MGRQENKRLLVKSLTWMHGECKKYKAQDVGACNSCDLRTICKEVGKTPASWNMGRIKAAVQKGTR